MALSLRGLRRRGQLCYDIQAAGQSDLHQPWRWLLGS